MKENSNKILLTYGAIGAVAAIAWTIVLYVMGVEAFTGALSFVGYIIPIVVAILAAIKAKRENEGYLDFKAALKITFGVLALTSLGSTIFNYILIYVIDVPFGEALMQKAALNLEQMLTKFGSKQEDIDKAIEKMNDPSSRNFGNMALGFLTYLIGWFIVAVIISLIVKKKKPEFADAQF
ncbi:MAG: DUF4199 domain-containing protein [Chitinophagaceae bacterium]|nr:MAG: DUF4199 domain-containing protein [Chitinophagaceae bacterium]